VIDTPHSFIASGYLSVYSGGTTNSFLPKNFRKTKTQAGKSKARKSSIGFFKFISRMQFYNSKSISRKACLPVGRAAKLKFQKPACR
jgi:hypothetical protein